MVRQVMWILWGEKVLIREIGRSISLSEMLNSNKKIVRTNREYDSFGSIGVRIRLLCFILEYEYSKSTCTRVGPTEYEYRMRLLHLWTG